MGNIFWGIYKNLEHEVLSLAEMVHFTDNQSMVYSVRIADLLIRCNVEAESLIRELYKSNNGESSVKVGEMLNAINDAWLLEKKQVSIVAPNMHYSSEYTSFCPYQYQDKDENDFYSAYNAVKHDRANNFEKYATVHFLLRAMGALFLLNIYYRNEMFSLHKARIPLDNRLGSSIFSFEINEIIPKYPVKEQTLCIDDELRAMYIVKPTLQSYKQYYDEADSVFGRQMYELKQGGYQEPEDEFGEKQGVLYSERFKIAADISVDMVNRISTLEQSATKKHGDLVYEAILNKSPLICYYPTLQGGKVNE